MAAPALEAVAVQGEIRVPAVPVQERAALRRVAALVAVPVTRQLILNPAPIGEPVSVSSNPSGQFETTKQA
ncbi:hypothetical protein FACS1894189_1270 [Planctomycetales bacterium]|nr:hypothetical protein FACS1894189_1270 [Planctomycetales bacterium]